MKPTHNTVYTMDIKRHNVCCWLIGNCRDKPLTQRRKSYNRGKGKTQYNKTLCGRDGRTICGPQCVPKSTSVTLAGPKRRD